VAVEIVVPQTEAVEQVAPLAQLELLEQLIAAAVAVAVDNTLERALQVALV